MDQSLIDMLEKRKWAVWNPSKRVVLQTFDSLDATWDAVEKIGGALDVIKSEELLERIKNA